MIIMGEFGGKLPLLFRKRGNGMYKFFAATAADASLLPADSVMKALILIVVVFAALVVLSLVIQLFGKFGATEKQPKEPKPAPAPKVVKKAAPAAIK